MDVSHLFKFCFNLLATITSTGNVPIGFDGDVLDAIAGQPFLVKTWANNRELKFLSVSRGIDIRLTAFVIKSEIKILKDLHGVILLTYNNATKEMSLILENCGKEDEGKYNVDERVADTSPNAFKRKAGKWNFKLNVIEPIEVKKCNVGGIFEMEIRNSSILRNLYYYDQIIVANLLLCDVAIHSHLHSRLRCGIDNDKLVIIIQNVTQRDIGLYSVDNTNNGSKRYYLNVTDQATNATFGDNVTIDWFYSQQAMNRTLRIIHPNNGIMMNLQPNNDAQIVTAFQTRLLYGGDVSRSYMSVTLLNVRQSDSGVYKIETLHGNTVSGCKHLIVQVGPLTANEVTESTPAVTKYSSSTRGSSLLHSAELLDSSSTRGSSLLHSAELLDTEEYTTSLSLNVRLTSPANPIITYVTGVPIYVVILVAVITLVMVGYVIWIRHKRRIRHKRLSTLETDRPRSLEESDHELYITPIGGEIHLPIPLMNDGHSSDLRTAQFDASMLILHRNQNLCMDGYETVDVPSNDAAERVCNNAETVYEPTESISKPVHDNFGYLTVIGVLDTSA